MQAMKVNTQSKINAKKDIVDELEKLIRSGKLGTISLKQMRALETTVTASINKRNDIGPEYGGSDERHAARIRKEQGFLAAVRNAIKVKEEALKAVTIYAAQILGVADRLGSLETGKAATLIVTNGDPLDFPSGRYQANGVRGATGVLCAALGKPSRGKRAHGVSASQA